LQDIIANISTVYRVSCTQASLQHGIIGFMSHQLKVSPKRSWSLSLEWLIVHSYLLAFFVSLFTVSSLSFRTIAAGVTLTSECNIVLIVLLVIILLHFNMLQICEVAFY